jgi:hypothetical protein
MLGSRIGANEAAAISTLKMLASAQAQCRAAVAIDTNGNGVGEFAFLGELSGADGIRTNESGGTGIQRISPAFASAGLGSVQNSHVLRSGYCFQMYLPASTAAPLAEAASGGAAGVSVSAALAEHLWSCYAWPGRLDVSGHRAFFVNQSGEVLACRNTTARYDGRSAVPAGTAAALAGIALPHMGSSIAANATGQD